MEQAKTQNEEHFNPYVKIEVLESERRLERQLHEVEKSILARMAELEKVVGRNFYKTIVILTTIIIGYLEWRFKS
jgi:tetrahydromethanopterin S-methyltransferase subunit G